MKTGTPLDQLLIEVQRQQASKVDYVTPAPNCHVEPRQDGSLAFQLRKQDAEHGITDHAHGQIASDLGVPKAYYDRMKKDAPDLLAANVNRWLSVDGRTRLVRTLDGDVRAWLSNRYRRLDYIDMMTAVAPTLEQLGGQFEVKSAELTDQKLYLKVVNPSAKADIAGRLAETRANSAVDARAHRIDRDNPYDEVQGGLVISNSEVGAGAISVHPLLFRLVCLNGLIVEEAGKRTTHLGQIMDAGEHPLFSDQTMNLSDRAFWHQFTDVVNGSLGGERFHRIVDQFVETRNRPIDGDPVKAVERLGERFGFTDEERGSVLNALIGNAARDGLSQFGAANAVTQAAQVVADYERSTELERVGGKVIGLDAGEWHVIAEGRAKVAVR